MKSSMLHTDAPVVSVAVFTYNQEQTIAQTLESILAQDFNLPFEIVIGEDASTDNTLQICHDYQQRYPEKIKLLQHKQNLGAIQNFKTVISAVQGKYTAFCAGDDYWSHTGKLRMQYNFLASHPDYTMAHTRFQLLEVETGEISDINLPNDWHPEDHSQLLLRGNFIGALTVMIRTEVLTQAAEEGLFDQGFLMEDYPLWLYATEKGKLGYINEFTAIWRKNVESLSNSRNLGKQLAFELSILEIRNYFANRQSLLDSIKPDLVMQCKKILHNAFMNKQMGTGKKAYQLISVLGGATWKEYLYVKPVLNHITRFSKRVLYGL